MFLFFCFWNCLKLKRQHSEKGQRVRDGMECVWMWAFASAWIPSNLELNYIVLDHILLFQIFPKRQFVWAVLFWKHACWEWDWARCTDEVCGHPFLFLHQSLQAHAVPGNSSQVNVCCMYLLHLCSCTSLHTYMQFLLLHIYLLHVY